MRPRFDIAIIGAGFSGAMLAYALRGKNARVALIDPSTESPRGAAYSTRYPEHLLNVPTIRMGAFADTADDFYHWVSGSEGTQAAARYGLAPPFAEDGFLPRALYGDYLASLTRDHGAECIYSAATSLAREGAGYRITLADGSSLEASRLVLATGNGFAREAHAGAAYYPEPWRCDFDAPALQHAYDPIVIIGTGLTAVDTLVSLLKRDITTPILLLSRHGLFPSVHAESPLSPPPAFDPSLLRDAPLSERMQRLRHFIKTQVAEGHSWQSCVDALRPHTISLWHDLSPVAQARFFRHAFSHWNRARHRMPRAQWQVIETNVSRYHILKSAVQRIDGQHLVLADGARITTSAIFDCRGPRYSVTPTAIFSSLIHEGIVTPHATGLGFIPHDACGRISAEGAPAIYAMGALLVGACLEATAVPELRAQVQATATALLND